MASIGVDFDGVIHAYSRGWQDGTIYDPPLDGALAALANLMTRYSIFIFTSRNSGQVAKWLVERGFAATTDDAAYNHDLPWDGVVWDTKGVLLVTNRKLMALVYIDDRAIRFTSWDQALADLRELGF